MPVNQIADVLDSALTPAFAAVQDDSQRLRLAFLKAFRLASLAIVITSALMAFVAPPLLVALLGDRWLTSVQLVPGLAIAAGLQALLRTGAPLYLGAGHPRCQFHVDLIQAVTIAALLFPAALLYGLPGMPLTISAGALAAAPAWWTGVRRCSGVTLPEIGRALGPPALAAGAMGSVVFLGNTPVFAWLDGPTPLLRDLMVLVLGLLACLVVLIACARFMPSQWGFGELKALLRAYGTAGGNPLTSGKLRAGAASDRLKAPARRCKRDFDDGAPAPL